MMHLFISYTYEDLDFAENVQGRLEKAHFETWINEHIRTGEERYTQIDQAIKNAFAMVVIMTPEARASEYVTYEWSFAVGLGIRIIPLKYKATTLHPRLEAFQYLDFTNNVRPWGRLLTEIEEAAKTAASLPIVSAAGVLTFIQQARVGLNSTDATVRREVIATLGQATTVDAQEMLLEALAHPVADVRQQAAQALGKIQYQAAVPRLMEVLQHDTVSGVRIAAIDALEVLKDTKALPVLLENLQRAGAEEKIRVVGALSSFGDTSVVPVLLELYQRATVGLREIIIHTLSNLDAEAALPTLREALYDADLVVCKSAARALMQIGTNEAMHMIVDAFLTKSRVQSERMAQTIAVYPLDGLIELLGAVYQGHVPAVATTRADREKRAQVRRRIVWVSGLVKSNKAVPLLIQSMDDEDAIVQRETVVAFKSICDERVLPALITILRWRFEDYDERTLLCAVQAVSQIGDASVIPHLKAVLERMVGRHTELAVQTIEIFGLLGDYEAIDYLKKLKFTIKRNESYAEDKVQELVEAIEQAIGKMRERIQGCT